MNKKFLSLVLALVMVLGAFTSVFAAEATKPADKKEETKPAEEKVDKVVGKKEKVQYLIDNKYVEGYEDGSLGLDKNIKRAEITKLIVFANGEKSLAEKLQGSMKLYTDVDTKHWANGVISVGTTVPTKANGLPMLEGYPDKSFKPENDVTYAELAKMLVVSVKTDLTADMAAKANKNWATQWMAWAAQLGILEDVKVEDSNKAANRYDAFTMMYNALYSMKYVKKMPAGETMGILSQLKNSELTLNQGDKAKTVKITNDTTFVLYRGTSLDANATRLVVPVRVSAITNPSYYYGSLLRVITNDKGEATHILELGNPRDLALGDRWADVAGATDETKTDAPARRAQVVFEGADAKAIDFVNGTVTNGAFVAGTDPVNKLNLTASTKYFVADVDKNQLTQVDSVEKALEILGYPRGMYLDKVYAGYNTIDGTRNHETAANTNVKGYKEATVVVFNSVLKDNNNATLLRVTNEATSKYDVTFEDQDGKVITENLADYRAAFPFNFNDGKFDVVRYSVNSALGKMMETMIDHSDTKNFPIVKVTEVNGRQLVVQDVNKDTAILVLDSEYDQFLKGQKLKGAVIQFRTNNGNVFVNNADLVNKINIVSVLPANMKLAGSLKGVVLANQDNQAFGKLRLPMEKVGDYNKVVIDGLKNLYGDYSKKDYFVISDENRAAYELFVDSVGSYTDGVRFKVQELKDKNLLIYDLEVLVAQDTWAPLLNVNSDILAAEGAVKALEEAPISQRESEITTARALVQPAKDVVNKLPAAARKPFTDRIVAAEKKVEDAENLFAFSEAVKAIPASYSSESPTRDQLEAAVKAYEKLTADQKDIFSVKSDVSKVNKAIEKYNNDNSLKDESKIEEIPTN